MKKKTLKAVITDVCHESTKHYRATEDKGPREILSFWDGVQALAAALYREEIISFEEAEAIIVKVRESC